MSRPQGRDALPRVRAARSGTGKPQHGDRVDQAQAAEDAPLRGESEKGLENKRVDKQADERTRVREGVQPVDAARTADCGLHEGAARRQEHVGDSREEQDAAERFQPRPRGMPEELVQSRSRECDGEDPEDGEEQQRRMDFEIAADRASRHPVGVKVAGQQQRLVGGETDSPDRRASAEHRQERPSEHRLDEEQKEGAEEDDDLRHRVYSGRGISPRGLSERHRAPFGVMTNVSSQPTAPAPGMTNFGSTAITMPSRRISRDLAPSTGASFT